MNEYYRMGGVHYKVYEDKEIIIIVAVIKV